MVEFNDLTEEQRSAITTLDRNITLTAGAGTGKTTTLTGRYLRIIESSLENAEQSQASEEFLLPENILTTTFTERAANELESSIRSDITDRIGTLDVDEFDAWRTVADELEHGYIHTLHGFCARLLREHALTIDEIDPGFDTLDENETAALLDESVGAVLEDHDHHPAMGTLAQLFSRRQLRAILTDLLGERPHSVDWADRWRDATEAEYLDFVEAHLHPIEPEEAAARLADDELVSAVETLASIVEEPPDIETGGKVWQRAEATVDVMEPGFDDGIASRRKQSLIAELSLVLTKGSNEEYASYTGAGTRWGDHPAKETFDSAFEQLVTVLTPEEYAVNVDHSLEAGSFEFVQALATLTQLSLREYEARKRRLNSLDFTDLISMTVDFLRDEANARTRERLRDQFAYILLDEFQDTDPRQWELIKLLTSADPDSFDADNVFVVGDVKQSIYRFRNADVTQFKEIRETIDAATSGDRTEVDDQLSTNFRTLPTVLETINELFDAIFVEDGAPYEAAPQRLTADREDPEDVGSVEYLLVPTDEELRADRFDHYPEFAAAEPGHDTELEAQALAARLSQILTEPYQVYPEEQDDDTEDEEDSPPDPRAVEPKDIAILIRSRTHLKKYERALADAEIPYSVASGLGFYDTPEIRALVNLFRCLADPSDERALYATLRSPLFGLTDDTLATLKLDGDPLWDALAASQHDSLRVAHDLLGEWRELAGVANESNGSEAGSWAEFLSRVIEDTGYLISISADERPQQARANVRKFREQLRAWSDDGIQSLMMLVQRIERRIELEGREGEADTSGEGVQILTVHDAKGMEFPFVVVPGIDRGFNHSAAIGNGQVEFERVGDIHAVGMKAPSPDDPFELEDTIVRQSLREHRRAEEVAEEKRVLYVAATRARDHLLLSGLHDSAGKSDAPTFTDLEVPDTDSPSSWRDWVQAELLTDEICRSLDNVNRVEQDYGDGSYSVSISMPPIEQVRSEPEADPKVDLTPQPEPRPITYRLSATGLATLRGGYGVLQLDEATRTAYVEPIEPDDSDRPDMRHGDEASIDVEDASMAPEQPGTQTEDEIAPMIFGEMVHRLCELRPPEDRWRDVMRQTLAAEDADVGLSPALRERVARHARRGIDYVTSQAAETNVEQQYDELYVTAEFENGEFSGVIDHLLVTPERYHIIDYKTGDVSDDEIEADAIYYRNQMAAYAVALNQLGTDRDVGVSLVFTSIDEVWEEQWSVSELDMTEERIQTELESELRSIEE